MGEKTGHIIWNKLDRLDITPTEALVLISLGHFASDNFYFCRPRYRQIAQKSHLGHTAIKKSLRTLKAKSLLLWSSRLKHPNDYILPLGASDSVTSLDRDANTPLVSDTALIEGAVRTVLAYAFASLLSDRQRRADASVDYARSIKRCGFLAGFRTFYRIKAKLKGLSDDAIHARILKALNDPESENNDDQ